MQPMKRLLIQTQLSNYDMNGKFVLECDSGWQMVMGRVREMLKLNHELDITVMGPVLGDDEKRHRQVITHPWKINPDLWEKYGFGGENRLHYFEHDIIPNALVTRYDFDWRSISNDLGFSAQKTGKMPKWDAVYINDPMHLRNFQAMFFVAGGYQPKFYVHSHFIDNPECPKFPTQASLWLGQCEAAIKADYNFWQCESSMHVFFESMAKWFNADVVEKVRSKSQPWDDGYSSEEINVSVDMKNVRFNPVVFDKWRSEGKRIIFVPNRIGGRGRSSDYTNCGKFMFDVLPELRKKRDDFVVLAGNPSQKFFNYELEAECGHNGYVSLVPDAFNRDEFKLVAKNSDIAVGLYDQDSYGGTVARECVDLGCLPLWIDKYEYSIISQEAGNFPFLARPDFSDLSQNLSFLLTILKDGNQENVNAWRQKLRHVVKNRCSYESTTLKAMQKMNLM